VSEPPSAPSFREVLRPFQRRMRRALLLRAVPVTCAASAAVAALATIGLHAGTMGRLASIAVAVAGGAAGAAAIAVARSPSLSATAAAIDRRYGLLERAVTALQFSSSDDPVSRLIVADAARHVRGLDPRLLDSSLSPRAKSELAVAMTIIVASAIVTIPRGADVRPESSGVVSAGAGGAAGSRRAPATTRRSADAANTATAEDDSSPAGPGRARTQASPHEPAAYPAADGRGGQSYNDTDASSQRTASGQGRPGGADDRRPADPARGGGEGSPSPLSPRRAAAPSPAGAGHSGEGTAAGSPSDLTPSREAGGVGAGDGLSAASTTAPSSPLPAIDRQRYRRAVSDAEAAIAQQRVPPQLRSYVRDYFLALRPEATDAHHR